LSGVPVQRGGWWFNQAGMVRAGAFCRALIRASGVPYLGNTPVVRLEKEASDWVAIGEFGQAIARAPHVVVACATDAGRVLGMSHLTLDALRGRITLLRDTDLATLKAPVSGEGYISNLPDGFCGVGATYENDQLGAWDEERAHMANLEKLSTIMREPENVVVTGAYQGVRAVGLGRLPYVGPVCDEKAWIELTHERGNSDIEHPPMIDGFWVMAGMGSRGVSMSTLCARILVSRMDGTPMPIDSRVVRCLSSARSVKKFVETL
ncbi:MAG: FAD-dependent oxidoreductase, partial [Burkholderiaceae bacterium]|nr:FAD-dependent oxidoreductase [Burkholderiaceae bacterium]